MARINPAFLRALDSNGSASSGALLKIYEAGTTTPVTTYSDAALSVANAWPIVAAADGRWPAIYLPAGVYKVRKETSGGTLLQEVDNVTVEQDSYATRAAFVTAAATMTGGTAPADGTIVFADGVAYERQAGASVLPSLSGWVPFGEPQPEHFGALGGATDDTAAFTAMEASAYDSFKVVQDHITTKTNFNSFAKRYWSPNNSKIDSTGGNLPPNYAKTAARAASFGSGSSILTAFDGDVSRVVVAAGNSVAGDALGEPASGYQFTPETSLAYFYTHLSSGHNEDPASNDGRTAYVQTQARMTHAGQGDALTFHGNITVTTTNSSATHFLANPAGVLYGGRVQAGINGCNLTTGEITMDDAGYRCRGTGFVINFTRGNSNTTLEEFWSGQRMNSNGAAFADACYQVVGKWKVAFDATTATLATAGAALAMSAGQKIELHATASTDSAGVKQYADTLNFWDIGYNSAAPGIDFRAAGDVRLRVAADSVRILGAGSYLAIQGTQVVGAQRAAIANDASGAANQATVNAILGALRGHGLIAT